MVLVRSLALAALLACGNATCSFTADYDCNGDDVAMLRQFGVNRTKCCEACAADARCAMAVLATDQGGVCLLKSACSDPRPGAKHRVLCNTGGVPPPPPAPAPGLVPKWAPTYFMAESTVIMPCNYSGLYDFDAYPALGRFGLVDYDWSNAKTYWANQSPMVCQGSMLQQAAQNKARTPSAKVFHYRNIVKALPWFEQVREKLLDPAYRGWFLPWRPGLRNGTTAGGQLYHDHEQTPGWPQPGGGQPADGVCHNHTTPPWGRGCDCGAGIPCGEYVFDHRNASLAAWLAGEYMNSSAFGLGNPLVDGFYLDDHVAEFTVVLYLTDSFVGGATIYLPGQGSEVNQSVALRPSRGCAAIHRQGSVLHGGAVLTEGVKNIMQFSLYYEAPSTPEPRPLTNLRWGA